VNDQTAEVARLRAIALDLLDRWEGEKMARLTPLRLGPGAYQKQASLRAECEGIRRQIEGADTPTVVPAEGQE
jgi:hypothetical protein